MTNQDIGVFFAEVRADGGLANASDRGATVSQVGTGEYVVDFGVDIAHCSAGATAGGIKTGIAFGHAFTTAVSTNPHAVKVYTAGATTGLPSSDKPFTLHVVF